MTLCDVPSIPEEPEGWEIISTPEATLKVDAFWGPLCPDSLSSFQELEKMMKKVDWNKYGMKLVLHPFALPYHRNSYMAA